MRNLSLLAPVALLAALFSAAPAAAETYEIDAGHTTIGFEVKHLGISNVVGRFGEFEGTINLSSDKPEATTAEVSVNAASVYTGLEKRDDHLRNPDFFNATEFAKVTFKSTGVKNATDKGFDLTGDLTMLGVTKPVTLTVSGVTDEIDDPWGGKRRGASATATFKRSDFGMSYGIDNGAVGDEVTVEIELELKRAP